MDHQDFLKQQAEAVSKAIEQQASQAEEAMAAQGEALVEKMAAAAMKRAMANAAGRMVIHAQQILNGMATDAGASMEALSMVEVTEIEELKVLTPQIQPIALPEATRSALPPSVRMANAALPEGPSKAAKRRARRQRASGTQEGAES